MFWSVEASQQAAQSRAVQHGNAPGTPPPPPRMNMHDLPGSLRNFFVVLHVTGRI